MQLAGAPALDDEGGGNVEEEISEEEDAGAKADDGVVEAQVRTHAQLGHTDVGTIEVGKHVDEHQVGNETAGDPRPRADRDVPGRMDAGVHLVITIFRGVEEALFDDRQLTSYSPAHVAGEV